MVVIYADILFLINLIINYLLLIITAKICDCPAKRVRCVLAAAAGSLYAVAAVIWPFLASAVFKLISASAMVFIAFGVKRPPLKLLLVFLAASAAFAGAVYACAVITGQSPYGFISPVTLKILLFSFCVCYVVLSLVFRRNAKHITDTVKLHIVHNGHTLDIKALVDTGNSLKDPITGARAVILSATDAASLFDSGTAQLIKNMRPGSEAETLCALNSKGARFRLLPYSTVGSGGGMLLAFTPEIIEINGKIESGAIAAVSKSTISDGGAYSALIGV